MKKRYIAAVAGLAAVFAVGGSLAYFNQNLEADNVIQVGKFDTTAIEEFSPEDGKDWEPGGTVEKQVRLQNTGTIPSVARVWFSESWSRGGEEFKRIDSKKEPGNETEDRFTVPKQPAEDGSDDLDGGCADGKTDADSTVVDKQMNLGDEWQYNQEDGCYYYTKILEPNDTTPNLLESITLIENVDMGKPGENKYYATVEDPKEGDWVNFSPDENGSNITEGDLLEKHPELKEQIKYFRSDIVVGEDGEKGYASADYTLTVVAQTSQATRAAVEKEFGQAAIDAAIEGNWNWDFLNEQLPTQQRLDKR